MPDLNPSAGPKRRRSTTAAQALASAKAATKGVKVGRPLTYSPALCSRAVALGMRGKSWAGIAREFNVSRKTIHEWEGLYPAFSDALARARAAAQAWWEAHGQKNLKAKHYQAQVSRTIMAAQFEDYREQRGGSAGLEALPDFLAAIMDAADQRRQKLPGDGARPIGPLDVVLEPEKSGSRAKETDK